MSSPAPELGRRMIRAGAGAGKTRTLVNTLIDFVGDFRSRNGRDPRIVVTTFTRKATQEVKERLLREALERKDEAAFEYLSHRSKVHISTIHGILSLLLSRFADRLGWPNDFRIEGGENLARVQRKILKKVLVAQEDRLALLEYAPFSELLGILLQYREARALHPELRPVASEVFREQSLREARQFLRVAHDLSDRIRACQPPASWIAWADQLAKLPRTAPTDDQALEKFIEDLPGLNDKVRKASRGSGKNPAIDEALAEEYGQFVEEIWKVWMDPDKNYIHRPSFWAEHETLSGLLREVAEAWIPAYDGELQGRGWVSMADLEILSLRLAHEHPEAMASFAAEWDYWMIDEFQDTSPLQVALLKNLISDRPHFVVGDPQQSIYFFRGARSQVFDEKFTEFQSTGAFTQVFEENRRSRAPVLKFINRFFRQRPGFSEMIPACTKPAMGDEIPAAEIRAVLPDEGGDGIDAIVERIQELIEMGEPLEGIAVLARKNDVLVQVQERARARGIPVQLHSAAGFSGRREIMDASAFLRFLANPYDDRNLLLLLRSPWFQISDEDLAKSVVRGRSLWSALLARPAKDPRDPVARLRDYLSQAEARGYSASLREFYSETGMVDSASSIDPSGRREANLWKFLNQLEAAQRQIGFSLLTFLAGLAKSRSTEEGNEDGDAAPVVEPRRVHLMTVHSSKGLEFRHVLIAQMHHRRNPERMRAWMVDETNGVWTLAPRDLLGRLRGTPFARELVEARDQTLAAESLRLLYVALTRAQQTVSLIWERNAKGSENSLSWTAQIPFLVQEGVQQEDGYILRTRLNAPVLRDVALVTDSQSTVRKPWKEKIVPVAEHLSATSALDAAVKSKAAARGAEVSVDGLRVAQRGTDAHRLFESLKYVDVGRVREMTGDRALQEALDWVIEQKDPNILQLISHGEVEWGYTAVAADGRLQTGQIDLWSQVDGRLWIVDYKTGSSEYADKAFDQMSLYGWALQKTARVPAQIPVTLLAVFPLEKKVEKRDFAHLTDLKPVWDRIFGQAESAK